MFPEKKADRRHAMPVDARNVNETRETKESDDGAEPEELRQRQFVLFFALISLHIYQAHHQMRNDGVHGTVCSHYHPICLEYLLFA